jgi:hypothetical protein
MDPMVLIEGLLASVLRDLGVVARGIGSRVTVAVVSMTQGRRWASLSRRGGGRGRAVRRRRAGAGRANSDPSAGGPGQGEQLGPGQQTGDVRDPGSVADQAAESARD